MARTLSLQLLGFALGFCIFANVCVAQYPSPGKIYAIQTTMDGGTIKPQGTGQLCNRLGSIGFSYFPPNPYTTEYKWRVASANNATGTITIHSLLDEASPTMNQLTLDDDPPYCNPVEREITLTQHPSGPFIIQDVRSGKCLYSYGSEVGIVIWRDDPYTQYWLFHEVEE